MHAVSVCGVLHGSRREPKGLLTEVFLPIRYTTAKLPGSFCFTFRAKVRTNQCHRSGQGRQRELLMKNFPRNADSEKTEGARRIDLSTVTECFTLVFAFWTLAANTAVVAHLSFRTLSRIGPFAVASGVVCGLFIADHPFILSSRSRSLRRRSAQTGNGLLLPLP